MYPIKKDKSLKRVDQNHLHNTSLSSRLSAILLKKIVLGGGSIFAFSSSLISLLCSYPRSSPWFFSFFFFFFFFFFFYVCLYMFSDQFSNFVISIMRPYTFHNVVPFISSLLLFTSCLFMFFVLNKRFISLYIYPHE
jgi:hypothetical protein